MQSEPYVIRTNTTEGCHNYLEWHENGIKFVK